MSRRDHNSDDHEGGHERWLVSYADFITLMFAFFAVLYATSEKDLSKAKEFENSLKKYLIKAGGFGESGQQINQGEKNNVPIESPIPTFRPNKNESEDVLAKTEQSIDKLFTKQEKERFVQDLAVDEWGIRITIRSPALYSVGSAKFLEQSVPFIKKLSEVLAANQGKIMIEGHVKQDEKGSERSTWDFSSARAINLLRYIQAQQKIPPSRLLAASFGDSRPLFEGNKADLNSRIEIVLLDQDLEL